MLKLELTEINAVRAKRSQYLSTVLTKEEARAVIQHVDGVPQLVVKLLYGCGLRLTEALRSRVKDIDFAQQQIIDGKGSKSRVTMLPLSVKDALRDHLVSVKRQHEQDLSNG